jgi:effector-binding domain-containing protein
MIIIYLLHSVQVGMMEVEIVNVEPQLVIGMRKKGAYAEIANMIPAVCTYAVSRGIRLVGPPIFICHEAGKKEAIEADKNACADIEIAVPVSSKGEETADIKFYELPGGKMIKTVHKGPYEECEPAYNRLFAWAKENGKMITGHTREMYMNDPREVKPEDMVTEIYAPIE